MSSVLLSFLSSPVYVAGHMAIRDQIGGQLSVYQMVDVSDSLSCTFSSVGMADILPLQVSSVMKLL